MSTPKAPLLFFAAWWPSSEDPTLGIFIKEHARSLLPHFDVHVVHLTVQKRSLSWPSIHVATTKDDGLTIHRIAVQTPLRRFGVHDLLVKRGYRRATVELMQQFSIGSYVISVRSHLTKLIPDITPLKGVPFLLIEHFSYYHRVFPNLQADEQKQLRSSMRDWFGQDALKRILVVSDDLRETLKKEFGVTPSQLGLIHNAVPVAFEYVAHERASDTIHLLSVAKWEEPKRPDLLIDAVRQLSDDVSAIELHIFGTGSLIDALQEPIKQLPSNIEVQLHGFGSKSDIARAMQRADLLIHPSDSENAPTVIAEALCCGLPVVSMNVNGIPAMVSSEDGMLTEPGSSVALKDTLLKAIEQLDQHDRAAIAKRAQEKFSVEAVGQMLSKEIKELTHVR